jgi:hypothetical protein
LYKQDINLSKIWFCICCLQIYFNYMEREKHSIYHYYWWELLIEKWIRYIPERKLKANDTTTSLTIVINLTTVSIFSLRMQIIISTELSTILKFLYRPWMPNLAVIFNKSRMVSLVIFEVIFYNKTMSFGILQWSSTTIKLCHSDYFITVELFHSEL